MPNDFNLTNADAPRLFEIAVKEGDGKTGSAYTFEVCCKSSSGTAGRKTYQLPEKDHQAYIDLMQQWATDFGVRVPINRRSASVATFEAPLEALLTENIAPEIVYGYGDPAILRVDGKDIGQTAPRYYCVTTSNDAPDSFPILTSEDLKKWELRAFVFPRGMKPDWVADGENIGDFWAPELHKANGEFRVYFVARHHVTRELCIGVASALTPDGPFISPDEPLMRGGVIDPHVLVDTEGQSYLYWKEDNNDVWRNSLNEMIFRNPALIQELFVTDEDRHSASLVAALWPWTKTVEPMERFPQQLLIEAVSSDFSAFEKRLLVAIERRSITEEVNSMRITLEALKTSVFAQELSADGINVVGKRIRVLCNDLPWEAHVIEGMWVMQDEGMYYMFYAGNDFQTADYGIGVARSSSPLGPFEKAERVFLQTTADWRAGPPFSRGGAIG